MNEFQQIMRLMNNGLNNPSTLKECVPMITKMALRFGKANEALEWVPKEASLNKKEGHLGLDNVVFACSEAIAPYQMEQSRVR